MLFYTTQQNAKVAIRSVDFVNGPGRPNIGTLESDKGRNELINMANDKNRLAVEGVLTI